MALLPVVRLGVELRYQLVAGKQVVAGDREPVASVGEAGAQRFEGLLDGRRPERAHGSSGLSTGRPHYRHGAEVGVWIAPQRHPTRLYGTTAGTVTSNGP